MSNQSRRDNESPDEWNRKLDEKIISDGILDNVLFTKLAEALHYDSASTVGWAENKLALFESLLTDNRSIQVFCKDTNLLQQIASRDEFEKWKSKYFGLK